MRIRSILAALALAVTAVLGSASMATADDPPPGPAMDISDFHSLREQSQKYLKNLDSLPILSSSGVNNE